MPQVMTLDDFSAMILAMLDRDYSDRVATWVTCHEVQERIRRELSERVVVNAASFRVEGCRVGLREVDGAYGLTIDWT